MKRSVVVIREEVERTLFAAGGDVARAAALVGCSVQTYQQRARRAGVDITRMRLRAEDAALAQLTLGDAALTPAGVTLALADYAVLQARAAEGYEVPILRGHLETAERIIATLTAHVERLAVSA
jgi:hypothetical protein